MFLLEGRTVIYSITSRVFLDIGSCIKGQDVCSPWAGSCSFQRQCRLLKVAGRLLSKGIAFNDRTTRLVSNSQGFVVDPNVGCYSKVQAVVKGKWLF